MAAAVESEDDLDAMLTAAAFVRLRLERSPLPSGLVDPVAEGGILAATPLSVEGADA
jgi:hypothetical protein